MKTFDEAISIAKHRCLKFRNVEISDFIIKQLEWVKPLCDNTTVSISFLEESIKIYFPFTKAKYLVDQYYDVMPLLVGSWKNEDYKIAEMTKAEFISLLKSKGD